MNAAMLIAGRELRDKTRLFLTAAALAVLPFLVALLPMVRPRDTQNLIVVLSGIAAFSMTVGTAAILGATTIGRELSDGRLSFYFAKPIAPSAIWWGKTVAAFVTSAACFLIVAGPSWLYASSEWRRTWAEGPRSVLVVSLTTGVIAYFVIHSLSTMARSRSPLIAADFVLAAATATAIPVILFPLRGTTILLPRLIGVLAIALLLVFVLAPLRQLANGRTDRLRNHKALSSTLWPPIVGIVLVAAGFVAWVVSAKPTDLVHEINIGQATTGWMVASGEAKGRGDYHASFLVDPNGKFRRMPHLWWGAEFSRDGRTLVWADTEGPTKTKGLTVMTLDLTRPDAKPFDTRITYGSGEFVLSDDGKRIAVRENWNLSVYELATGRMLFAGKAFSTFQTTFFFATPDVVRIIQRVPPAQRNAPMQISDVDVAKRTITTLGQTEPVDQPFCIASQDGSRLLFRGDGLLVDGRTGATLARYGAIGRAPLFLGDGSVAVTTPHGVTPARVTIHRANATPVEVVLPKMMYASIRGEIAPGKLAVQAGEAWEERMRATRSHLYVIDAATGRIERTDAHVRGPMTAWTGIDPRPLPIDGGRPLAAFDAEGKVILWNPRTGATTRAPVGQ